MISTSGCAIGVKEKVRVVYVSHFKTPEECKGALKIGENTKVNVTIEGKDDIATRMDLGGYYAVKAADLKGFIDAVNKVKALEKR